MLVLRDKESVRGVRYSPNGRYIATLSDYAINIWESHTGRHLHRIPADVNYADSIAFSPVSNDVSVIGTYSSINIWELCGSLEFKRRFLGHQSWVTSITYSPDGKSIASSSTDNRIHIWEHETGKQIKVLEMHVSRRTVLRYSPDSRRLAAATDSGNSGIYIWDCSTWKCAEILKKEYQSICAIDWAPNGEQIVCAPSGNDLLIVDSKTGHVVRHLKGAHESNFDVLYSPDGETVTSICWDSIIRVWEVNTGNCISMFRSRLRGLARFDTFFAWDKEGVAVGPIPFFSLRTILSRFLRAQGSLLRDPRIWERVWAFLG